MHLPSIRFMDAVFHGRRFSIREPLNDRVVHRGFEQDGEKPKSRSNNSAFSACSNDVSSGAKSDRRDSRDTAGLTSAVSGFAFLFP